MAKTFLTQIRVKTCHSTRLSLFLLPLLLVAFFLLYLHPTLPGFFESSILSSLPISRIQPQFWPPPSAEPPLSHLPARRLWKSENTKPICRQRIETVAHHYACLNNDERSECKNLSKSYLFSQFGQDHYVYMNHFSRLKRRGIYLDVAANEATKISNTFFMDECLGWDGICVEANPIYHKDLTEKRSCRLIPTCVSNVEGHEVEFLAMDEVSGIKDTNKYMENGTLSPRVTLKGVLKLKCTTLGAILNEQGVKVVDYMSLDVEGHESSVLKGVDWNSTRFNVLTVETAPGALYGIEKFLVPHGYVRHMPVVDGKRSSLLTMDAVFLHETVKWGEPK